MCIDQVPVRRQAAPTLRLERAFEVVDPGAQPDHLVRGDFAWGNVDLRYSRYSLYTPLRPRGRLLTRDDVEITIPNALIANSTIVNESGGPSVRFRTSIVVGVAYGSDIDKVREVLMAAAVSVPEVVDDPEPRIRFIEMGDSALIYKIQCWIAEPSDRGRAVDGLNTAVYQSLGAASLSIPFPQRHVHLSQAGS